MNRIEVIATVERRRRWSRVEKERWVSALVEPGAVAADVARKAGVDRSLLYRWRQQLAAARGVPRFIPVTIAGAKHESAVETPPPSEITIEFCGGVRLKVSGAPDARTLTSVIDALSKAERHR